MGGGGSKARKRGGYAFVVDLCPCDNINLSVEGVLERRMNLRDDHPVYKQAAGRILRRYENHEAEANITSAIRDFLIETGLANAEEIVEENPPGGGSRRAVDLTALDTFIEVKRRIGGKGFSPDEKHVEQLDDYLEASQREDKGRMRMGVLTDGKYWLLRWPGAGRPPKTEGPYGFVLESDDKGFLLYEWLRDEALESLEDIPPNKTNIEEHFSPRSLPYRRDIAALSKLYYGVASLDTIMVKRRLWWNLLRTALGELAQDPVEMNDLFIRHTYLTAVTGMVLQASFGMDVRRIAEEDPADLLKGNRFYDRTALRGIVESDFFAWPKEKEVEGHRPFLRTLARRVCRFDWKNAPNNTAAILYEAIIPPDERRQLGEYYTPAWLARTMVRELVTEPLKQKVCDPACGSGTFIAEAVTRLLGAAREEGLAPEETLDKLRDSVVGIDIHPVAVHLARSAWVLASRPAINAASDAGVRTDMSVPVYLGDSLQLRFRMEEMLDERRIIIKVGGEGEEEGPPVEMHLPTSVVERADKFDRFMFEVAEEIERGRDPMATLDEHFPVQRTWQDGLANTQRRETSGGEREMLVETVNTLKRLRREGRDHIWAYYTRNLVRPVALASQKMDVVIGNPPWLTYNKTIGSLRAALEDMSKNLYGIRPGGHYTTHQDVAGLFYARAAHMYVKEDGLIGMVMPHSALQAGQYVPWRTGNWKGRKRQRTLGVDFTFKRAWDLEGLEPNNFFPIPASVVFARRVGDAEVARPLASEIERWVGAAGSAYMTRTVGSIPEQGKPSRYGKWARQGATIVTRRLFFVNEVENPTIVPAGQTVTVRPRLGSQDKKPWTDIDLSAITDQTIEEAHLFDIHLGETVVPYATLEPLRALLPLKRGDAELAIDNAARGAIGRIGRGALETRMRERWRTVNDMWEVNKAQANRLDLLGQLDYMSKLSAQLEWQGDPGNRPVRVVYTTAGVPTAALIGNSESLVDTKLYWLPCRNEREANYVVAIINSQALYDAVAPLMSKGQFGARDLHKHLWKLPIPGFDESEALHKEISEAGAAARERVPKVLERLRKMLKKEGKEMTVTAARKGVRAWLGSSREGKEVERLVGGLLG